MYLSSTKESSENYASSASSMSISETSSLNSASRMPKSIQSDANASSPTKMPCSGSLVCVNNSRSLSPKNNQVDLTNVSKSSNIEERPPTQSTPTKMKVDQLSQSQEVIAEKLAQTPKLPVNFRIALLVKTITEF
ncbi:unnamed protein product [Allacma fusca]|uniref:Uncharacterized protein n=1 Tax=Allacma fusca TaxID=39272 RepID=A0A8J2LHZ3_9HEXA|nr:unnamed protein product [Allacma fusca]